MKANVIDIWLNAYATMNANRKHENARQLISLLLAGSSELDQAVAAMQQSGSPEELKHFRRKVGAVLGEIYLSLLQDLFAEYPDLELESFK